MCGLGDVYFEFDMSLISVARETLHHCFDNSFIIVIRQGSFHSRQCSEGRGGCCTPKIFLKWSQNQLADRAEISQNYEEFLASPQYKILAGLGQVTNYDVIQETTSDRLFT